MKIPIAADAWRFVIPLILLAGFLFWLDSWLTYPWAVVCVLGAFFCLYFFRDFERITPKNDSLIYSPADGKVMEVGVVKDGPLAGQNLIRIFLSVLDVHVQRSPVDGRVTKIVYKKGLFLDARDPNAHLQNEQSEMTIRCDKGSIVVTQIAGLIARRILCWVKEGDSLSQGVRYGLIRFGSQVDVVMPANTSPKVKVGERVVGGETILAEWKQ